MPLLLYNLLGWLLVFDEPEREDVIPSLKVVLTRELSGGYLRYHLFSVLLEMVCNGEDFRLPSSAKISSLLHISLRVPRPIEYEAI